MEGSSVGRECGTYNPIRRQRIVIGCRFRFHLKAICLRRTGQRSCRLIGNLLQVRRLFRAFRQFND
jgi:hypothetical protein